MVGSSVVTIAFGDEFILIASPTFRYRFWFFSIFFLYKFIGITALVAIEVWYAFQHTTASWSSFLLPLLKKRANQLISVLQNCLQGITFWHANTTEHFLIPLKVKPLYGRSLMFATLFILKSEIVDKPCFHLFSLESKISSCFYKNKITQLPSQQLNSRGWTFSFLKKLTYLFMCFLQPLFSVFNLAIYKPNIAVPITRLKSDIWIQTWHSKISYHFKVLVQLFSMKLSKLYILILYYTSLQCLE